MRYVSFYFSLIIAFLFSTAVAQNNTEHFIATSDINKIIIMRPTGKMINVLPEMEIVSDTSIFHKEIIDIVNNSFIKEALDLYFLASNYLKNNNQLNTIEPAYLALSQNDGGYAKTGFYIKTEEGHIEKSEVPYIDIVENRMLGNINRLMSITQLYPHEMGHVIYGMLNSQIKNYHSRSVDMHYFSVRTDYSTAFNEGFAEHIENVSRIYEQNQGIKKGIFEDIEKIKIQSNFAINGFENDFIFPTRIGYFKISMPIWYQKYENLKRYEHAINGTAKYLNSTLELNNIEDRLTIRNSGIRPNKDQLRNYVQLLSTEGVISAFFTKLTQSELANHFLDTSFYRAFLVDTSLKFNPKAIFTPYQNQFLKYFYVFHEYMSKKESSGSVFVDFMDAYIQAFPSEELTIKKIFKESTNIDYTNDAPIELWILVKEYSHRLLVPDPYDAITLPIYTFDLNAAEIEDLLTIKGVTIEEARHIIKHRNTNGFFVSLDQLNDINGLTKETIDNIIKAEYDESFVDNLRMPELSFNRLLIAPVTHLLFKALLYYILIFGIIYWVFLYKKTTSIKRLLLIAIGYLGQWLLFIFSGLFFVVISVQPLIFILALAIIFILLSLLIYRNNSFKRNRSIFATTLMGLSILLSVI